MPHTAPRVITSRRRITYKPSKWHVHEFEVWSGELLCRAAALRVEEALLLWVGGAGEPQLLEVALGMSQQRRELATSLLGGEGAAVALARRLSAALARPVYVCGGLAFDRFTQPLIERGLIAEIKSRPECF